MSYITDDQWQFLKRTLQGDEYEIYWKWVHEMRHLPDYSPIYVSYKAIVARIKDKYAEHWRYFQH